MTKRDYSATRHPLVSGGFLWGPRRVQLGISIRQLEAQSGVYRGFLSRMENGVMIPTGEEFERVMKVIESAPDATTRSP